MNYKNFVVVISSLVLLAASPVFALTAAPSSPDYVPPAPDPRAVASFINLSKYNLSVGPNLTVIQPHTPYLEKDVTVFYPEYVHEIVDLRADLTDVQNNVSRLSQQQFSTSNNGSALDPRCDSLDARVRQLEQQLAALTMNGAGGPSLAADVDLSNDPNIQTITRRLTNVEAVAASNDTFIKRIMKLLKIK